MVFWCWVWGGHFFLMIDLSSSVYVVSNQISRFSERRMLCSVMRLLIAGIRDGRLGGRCFCQRGAKRQFFSFSTRILNQAINSSILSSIYILDQKNSDTRRRRQTSHHTP